MWRGHRRTHGFATAAVLALLAVIALLSVGAMHDALFASQLAGTRALHQRASVVAELGIQAGLARLAHTPGSADVQFALRPLDGSEDTVTVSIRRCGSAIPAAGFSVGRFRSQPYEIESTAHTARNVTATHVRGATQLMPVVSDPAREPWPGH